MSSETKTDRVATVVPGRAPIELVAFYEELREYYPYCELQTKRWFVDHVQPDWWIFDVGANIGYYTILFSQLAPQGRVFAFEPTATVEKLRANLAHNGVANADIHQVALGAVTGEQTDRIYRLWGSEGDVGKFPFYRLDDFVERHAVDRIDCIKIDVDSFDFEVLLGAEKTLAKHDPMIVVELNHALAKRNQSAGEALAWLAGQGYDQAVVLDHDNFVLQRAPGARADLAEAPRLQLVFPPALRVTERLDTGAAGTGIPAIVNSARLVNGATMMPSAAASGAGSVQRLFQSVRSTWDSFIGRRAGGGDPVLRHDEIVGATIESEAQRWSYALLLDLAAGDDDAMLSIEVGVTVLGGMLGIALSGDDGSHFTAPERTLSAMTGQQSIVLSARCREARTLVLRNVALGNVPTRFRIDHLEARRAPRA